MIQLLLFDIRHSLKSVSLSILLLAFLSLPFSSFYHPISPLFLEYSSILSLIMLLLFPRFTLIKPIESQAS